MKLFKCILISFLLLTSFLKVTAQNNNPDREVNYLNAVQGSQSTFSGTARFQSIGGATTALGADMGTLGSNPAGLGMTRLGHYARRGYQHRSTESEEVAGNDKGCKPALRP